jgi:hypothetical protein
LTSRFGVSNTARYHCGMSPLRTALLAQLLGGFIAAAAIQLLNPQLFAVPAAWAVGQGLCAALVSYKLEAPRWWLPIHLGFLPLAVAANRLGIPPLAWLGAFLLLFLLFWRTDKSQVPLFLTNQRTAQAIADLLPATPCSCIDLGCGTGSLLKFLAAARPECTFLGVEHAPLPFLLAWLRSRRTPNLVIRYGDFWQEDLGKHQTVYAFLSPVPMARLWQKLCSEMAENSLLISNSFEIPHVVANHATIVPDRRRSRLFCYQIPSVK